MMTDFCDVFCSISEISFNNLYLNVSRQRPSLFNYGTKSFAANPGFFCSDIGIAPGLPNNQPRVSLQPLIPVVGTDGRWGIEYYMQLADLRFDFHPGTMDIPAQLHPPLPIQGVAVKLQACGGIGCPSLGTLTRLGMAESYNSLSGSLREANNYSRKLDSISLQDISALPFDKEKIHCFCLELYALVSFRKETINEGPVLFMDLKGIEIVDIKPDGLENTLECMITTTIILGILPKIKLALNDIILSLGSYGSINIGFTPISDNVPFNPSVANNKLSAFVNIKHI